MVSNTTLLAIWQQSEYDWRQFSAWYSLHQYDDLVIEPERWTIKLRLLQLLIGALPFLPRLVRFSVALALIAPFEQVVRWVVASVAAGKLWWLRRRGLIVVAIAGSYAKTSTKHILEHTLAADRNVLITPHSINTLMGVSGVIIRSLHAQHQVFIVEFGEYHPQDIPRLTSWIRPDYGILTPIGRQHLEIIGGFDELIKTFSSFVTFFHNAKNILIAEENREHFSQQKYSSYGKTTASTYRTSSAQVTRRGTQYAVYVPEKFEAFIPLFGEHQAINTLPALWLAQQLGVENERVVERLSTLPFIPRRHEPTFAANGMLILDNSYNTNPDSVQSSLQLIEELKPQRALIVTMGFTELGDEAKAIHRSYGKQLAKTMDVVGLIETRHTPEIIDGFVGAGGKREQIVIGKTMDEAIQLLSAWMGPDAILLLEGGYRELYT